MTVPIKKPESSFQGIYRLRFRGVSARHEPIVASWRLRPAYPSSDYRSGLALGTDAL